MAKTTTTEKLIAALREAQEIAVNEFCFPTNFETCQAKMAKIEALINKALDFEVLV